MIKSFRRSRKTTYAKNVIKKPLSASKRTGRKSVLVASLNLETLLKDSKIKKKFGHFLQEKRAYESFEFLELTDVLLGGENEEYKDLIPYLEAESEKRVNIEESVSRGILVLAQKSASKELDSVETQKLKLLIGRARKQILFFLQVSYLNYFITNLVQEEDSVKIPRNSLPKNVLELINKRNEHNIIFLRFEQYLLDCFAEESLYFLLATEKLRRDPKFEDRSFLEDLKNLKDNFVEKDSDHEVNIEMDLRNEILAEIEKVLRNEASEIFFDKLLRAEKECEKILERNFYARFVKNLTKGDGLPAAGNRKFGLRTIFRLAILGKS
eukprot:snap_masked-scaffold_5-processed-gene-0.26-mRNA-1 protein AED:0.18 eAED:1.00 QI:0/-1/0/1/-1/1/1/0/324